LTKILASNSLHFAEIAHFAVCVGRKKGLRGKTLIRGELRKV